MCVWGGGGGGSGGSGTRTGRKPIFFSSHLLQRPFYTSRFAVLSWATSGMCNRWLLIARLRREGGVCVCVGGGGGGIRSKNRSCSFFFLLKKTHSYMLQHLI